MKIYAPITPIASYNRIYVYTYIAHSGVHCYHDQFPVVMLALFYMVGYIPMLLYEAPHRTLGSSVAT